jgi:hypothetical protein
VAVRKAKIKLEPFEQNGAKISRYRSQSSAPSRRVAPGSRFPGLKPWSEPCKPLRLGGNGPSQVRSCAALPLKSN